MLSPVVIVPGHFLEWRAYLPLASRLRAEPFNRQVWIAPIEPYHWWQSSGANFRPVIDVMARCIEDVAEQTGMSVTVIGHSAGGRLTRKFLGEDDYCGRRYAGHRFVNTLVCLGTPHHSSAPASSVSTRWANEHYPGAFFAPKIRYVSVISRYIKGNRHGTLAERTAYALYESLLGAPGDVWGDGIVPEPCMMLEGSEVIQLEGVYHLPVPLVTWYDAPHILPQWAQSI
jgi:triacylglycerol esterase/lipase EstA (alpha/beta hydrolase family)